MDLSTADADKWQRLLDSSTWGQQTPRSCALDYEVKSAICQRQRRLTDEAIALAAERYQTGDTIRQLATEFGCGRSTLSRRFAAIGVTTRGRPASEEKVDEMVRLYESGQSLAKIGEQVGLTAKSVLKYLRQRGVATRDSHGRQREK